ncbi:hypothetical protein K2173_015126 [Erythroxylum novogranatense]|uniref:SLH domain-containing protein n=1 Tax=Erythroxylum novogranatense TaxID=1862640 RepID=A0AAV8T249_9ROSI|nr:hypothetical protein K2173_015126 [Erythroxylum novogranatense]
MGPSTTRAPASLLLLRTTSAATPRLRRHNFSIFGPSPSLLRTRSPTLVRLSASPTDSRPHFSWFSPDQTAPPAYDCNGWAFKIEGFPTVVAVIGTCAAAFVATIAFFLLSSKGIKWQLHTPHTLRGVTFQGESETKDDKTCKDSDFGENLGVSQSQAVKNFAPDVSAKAPTSVYKEKHQFVKISTSVDSAQLEALSSLKKLKIIEDVIKADELCSRREYARWLIRLNSLLERNPKHRIVPSISLSGSVVAAFDDISAEDSDFQYVQSLAEAGIIPSKLSGASSGSDSTKLEKRFLFYPDRFISRQDLIDWKAQLEYEVPSGIIEQMSGTKAGYMDVSKMSSDASPELLFDMTSQDRSIIRKVFGQTRRFQPNKPVTKAQVAVALTSGRMTAAICDEILRQEAENTLRESAMEEIRFELLNRGDIQRYWDGKKDEERRRGLHVEEIYTKTLHELEQEEILQVKTSADCTKEKAAMECQRQLLSSLKEEVVELSAKLASERATYVVEQCSVNELFGDLQTKQERMLDTKSILEAEIEALRILRSWVEDDARKSQARAKVLEEIVYIFSEKKRPLCCSS